MKRASAVLAVVLVLGWVGEQDYQDAKADMDYQCDMIKKGYWPAEVNPHCKSKTEVVSNAK